ncbi:hypothetical protein [Sphingobium yanoikuyae]|jgi:hypothetical protein|nr:hypothetical protein [Sphingobium yanoikuyae]
MIGIVEADLYVLGGQFERNTRQQLGGGVGPPLQRLGAIGQDAMGIKGESLLSRRLNIHISRDLEERGVHFAKAVRVSAALALIAGFQKDDRLS